MSNVRKLSLLFALLLTGLAVASTVPVKNAEARICCSACETDPPPLPCRSGCSPSC